MAIDQNQQVPLSSSEQGAGITDLLEHLPQGSPLTFGVFAPIGRMVDEIACPYAHEPDDPIFDWARAHDAAAFEASSRVIVSSSSVRARWNMHRHRPFGHTGTSSVGSR